MVSTHSRPKAAGPLTSCNSAFCTRFNTQPPEGGWPVKTGIFRRPHMFQHTAARRRLAATGIKAATLTMVSTHSRPKAAGVNVVMMFPFVNVSTHSRPKAAGIRGSLLYGVIMFQHTAARRRLGRYAADVLGTLPFQHTAARRRLAQHLTSANI